MSLLRLCQRCQQRGHYWHVHIASFNVGELEDWKLVLCETCTAYVQKAVQEALASPILAGKDT